MRDIPQINEDSGLSYDYMNEYFGRMMTYDIGWMDAFNEICRNNPVKKYEERFPKETHRYNTYPGLEAKIIEIDNIAESFNKKFDGNKPFNDKKFKEIINKVYGMIYGKEYYE